MKTLDHTKVSLNMNIALQKIVSPFFLSIRVYGKNLHNFLIDLGASCNIMPSSIAQRLGVSHQPSNQVVIQLDKIEEKVIGVLKDVWIQLTFDPQI